MTDEKVNQKENVGERNERKDENIKEKMGNECENVMEKRIRMSE